jgi:hypothetical protein
MEEKWELLILGAVSINTFTEAGKSSTDLRDYLKRHSAYPKLVMPSVDDLMEAAIPLILAACWEPVNIIILHSGVMHYIFRKRAAPKEPA